MKLFPFGVCLPVHCCCEPNRRFGWVPVPEKRLESPGSVKFMTKLPSYRLLTGEYSGPVFIESDVERITHPAYDGPQLAVKSNDIPIDVWRKVPGFIEDRGFYGKEARGSKEADRAEAGREEAEGPRAGGA